MKYIYTASFTPIEDSGGYYARVPDLPGCITTGRDLYDAISQITDAASAWLSFAEDEALAIPAATPQAQLLVEGAVYSLIQVDTIAYRALTDTHTVHKNISLPAWMANMADKHRVDCSQLLQEALRRKFGDM